MSWTPKQFNWLLKGAQHNEIDEYERLAKSAMFNRYAMNATRASEKKLFDAAKARKRLENNDKKWKDSRDVGDIQKRYNKMKQALKGYTPVFNGRG